MSIYAYRGFPSPGVITIISSWGKLRILKQLVNKKNTRIKSAENRKSRELLFFTSPPYSC